GFQRTGRSRAADHPETFLQTTPDRATAHRETGFFGAAALRQGGRQESHRSKQRIPFAVGDLWLLVTKWSGTKSWFMGGRLMGKTHAFHIRRMMEDDLPAADHLRNMAGWNQLPGDWLRLLRYEPDGCFVAVVGNDVCGTVTTTTYDAASPDSPRVAWIGMMLVHPDYRRRGIATALMQQAIEYLQQRSVHCIMLDATPAGEFVYAQLGFRRTGAFRRFRKPSDDGKNHRTPDVPLPSEFQAAQPSNLSRAGELKTFSGRFATADFRHQFMDVRAFGAKRHLWLQRLAADSCVVEADGGFGMLRGGQEADYLGPIVALDELQAAEVIDALLSQTGRSVFWDVPPGNQSAESLALHRGFEPIRELTRMCLGERNPPAEMSLQFALADPGTG
ncbi:MAG: GNAT family N-acetyltransferase, partial [Planctomycetaceae bacterium]|nr:GNAT family N-acetyltransferase [Planctomycetaceae bacterium]